ncbi:MAG: recombination protein O N-terminal domain-containing protein [Candidatus Paceibacterota bacterium]
MSYRIYTTDALILRSATQGEANRFFWLYTRDFGLVYATAQSVRKHKSKLRYALQDYMYSSVSLVRGKRGWRIVGAQPQWSIWGELRDDSRKLAVGLNILSLLRRLVRGQARDVALFSSVRASFDELRTREFAEGELGGFELVAILRVLDLLGYLGSGELEEHARNLWESREWEEAEAKRKVFIKTINASLRSSQL